MWGTPLIVLLVGGGFFFTFYSRFIPFRHFPHAIQILRGKYDDENDPGQISHFEALSSALASTVGMGNIGGVALAIHTGGPGALFWMWVSAIIGMATKYFTCTLSIMYRGKDDTGEVQGGPMYVIEEGLGKAFRPLAVLFSVAGLIGCLVLFQANQLAQIVRDLFYQPNDLFTSNPMAGDALTGIIAAAIVSLVIFGGIKRIGKVASRLVPFMVIMYLTAAIVILGKHFSDIPAIFSSIISDAFTGDAVLGGALGSIIIVGIKRAAFSNEAGIGTEVMAHGAAKTKEPVREGLVAMMGPFIDTIIVCSITAFVILASGVDFHGDNGVTLTVMAFKHELGITGEIILVIAVLSFSLSTMFGYSYYGRKCTSYLFGTKAKPLYNYFYVGSIVLASVISIDIAINLIDGMFALMAIPTMTSALLLSPKVMAETRRYFSSLTH
ncbi:MAG: alanine:cation symporter family protein [Candidatus Marinimicrobia bacterium]|nr:alanine:cation symporter family protein [Candidatus Neomarinimicrobiota bacterium]MBT3501186.1 alanine:cation symporter family protein [Candidatus Neomarinimicrobiota bacterium]MBT3839718.1 alanine:cation symporter family protein [Candidatus Neomarinimicrobiota bacterium]MBT3998985.1 alanine:cation symporter family protein [Candidatus Neomarinimicrobiota bacterium]MBT4282945.1 alanine:cation symporter family protein [Candidatus Neomarinimicrobiota bacterium]